MKGRVMEEFYNIHSRKKVSAEPYARYRATRGRFIVAKDSDGNPMYKLAKQADFEDGGKYSALPLLKKKP